MSGMTSPTSIRVSPLGNMNPNVPLFDQSGEAAKILGAYGLQGPQISQNPVFQRTQTGDGSFLGMHPGVEGALSGAIMGAAFTPPSHTIGEGISNVAQGMLGAQEFTRQRQMQQFMSPFNVANSLSEIQARGAQMDYLHGLGKFYGSRADNQREVLGIHQTADGRMFKLMNDGSSDWVKDPQGGILIGPPTASQRPHAGDHPGGLMGQIVESIAGPPPADPSQAPEWGQRAAQVYTGLQGSISGAHTSGHLGAEENDPHYVPPDVARRTNLYAKQAQDDIKATESQLKEAMKKPISNKMVIPQLQDQLNQKKSAYGGYASKLLDGVDVTWTDFLKQSMNPQQNTPTGGNPFRH